MMRIYIKVIGSNKEGQARLFEKWHLCRDLRHESELFKQRADGRVFLEEETICAKKL